MRNYPGVAARVFDTPLLVHPGKAVAVAESLGPRLIGGGAVTVDGAERVDHAARGRDAMGVLGDGLADAYPEDRLLFRVGPVAIIPIEGTLVHKGKWVGAWSGETSYEGIQTQVAAALDDVTVQAVVLEVDSFGGEVSGAFDCAEAIHELAQAKPVVSILTDHAYSAGYLLASAARGIIIPPAGGAGSIGVITLHADYSRWLAEEGIKVTVISAGEHKAEGNPFEKLPVAVRDQWQAELEEVRGMFAEAVGRYRGKRLSADAALATEAACFLGEAAVEAGLADAVARPSEAFREFVADLGSGPLVKRPE